MRVNGSTRPHGGSRSGTGSAPRRRSRTALLNGSKAVLAVALVLGAASACDKGTSDGTHAAKDWKVGDCAGPDSSAKDAYQPLDCGDSKATIKALEVKDGAVFADSIQCPAGTDEIISVKVSFGSGDAKGGIPSKTICGRNLAGEHPGDAGAGGGQLVKGDCVTDQAKEVPCAGGGGSKVLDLTKKAEDCPSGSTPLELFPSPGRPYDAICTGKA
ncbi:LppU/SCO3897 family protein [Streptomyces sp. NPDC001274]